MINSFSAELFFSSTIKVHRTKIIEPKANVYHKRSKGSVKMYKLKALLS